MEFYAGFIKKTETLINSAITSNVDVIYPWVNGIFKTALAVYVIIWGIQQILGISRGTLVEGVLKVMKVGFILTVATKAAYYNTWVVDIFTKGPDELCTVITGTKAGAEKLDALLTTGIEMGQTLMGITNAMGVTNFTAFFQGLAIIIAVSIATLYAAFLLVLSKVALCLILSVGPIFIALALFDVTKAYFEAWVKQLSNYFILIVLVYMVLSTYMNLYSTVVDVVVAAAKAAGQDSKAIPLADTGYLVVLSFMQWLIFKQVPGLASGLAGGVQLGQWSWKEAKEWASDLRATGRGVKTAGKTVANVASTGKRAFQRSFQGRNTIANVSERSVSKV